MKILITKLQLHEAIRASEAYDDLESVETVANGKRGVAWISFKDLPKKFAKKIIDIISQNSLHTIHIKGNPNNTYIVYKNGYEKDAKELESISKKYGGYLSVMATEEDSRRIGQLLEYDPQDIENYIVHNRKIQQRIRDKE